MKLKYAVLMLSSFFCYQAIGSEIKLKGEVVQGGLVLGWTSPGATIYLDDLLITQGSLGNFLLGFPFDSKKEANLRVQFTDGTSEKRVLNVKQRIYNIQRIDGLPSRKVTPKLEDMRRIKSEKVAMKNALEKSITQPLYISGFVRPVVGPITGVYGSQRILNGKPKRPHFGLDIAAPEGTEVRSTADGVIGFSHSGMFFNGKTIVIDHGLGLRSVYIHMSVISVKKGQKVSKGQVIGKVGKTGRTTGPHLHWGIRLNNVELDPGKLIQNSP